MDDNQGDFSIDIEFQNSYDEKRTVTIKGLVIDLDYCSGSEIGIFLVEVGFLISKFLSRKSTVLYVLD